MKSAIALTLTFSDSLPELAYQRLDIDIEGAIAEPQDLVALRLPEGLNFAQGVILNGRAPIWVYGFLVHECHAAAWVACYDPRLGGAVVVESHRKGVNVGQLIALS